MLILYCAVARILNDGVCAKTFGLIFDANLCICAGGPEGGNTCHGDSGVRSSMPGIF